MRISELRQLLALEEFENGDCEVLVDGYEGGMNDITPIEYVTAFQDNSTPWYYGNWYEAETWRDVPEDLQGTEKKVLVLRRGRNEK